jgi:hypothetical protein
MARTVLPTGRMALRSMLGVMAIFLVILLN